MRLGPGGPDFRDGTPRPLPVPGLLCLECGDWRLGNPSTLAPDSALCGWIGILSLSPSLSRSLLWTTLICGSHHLLSQAGWNRCTLILILILFLFSFLTLSLSSSLSSPLSCWMLGCACIASVLHSQHLLVVCPPGSARGCPGSTCISPAWLERCIYLSLSSATVPRSAHWRASQMVWSTVSDLHASCR